MISVLRNNGVELRHVFYADGVATDASGAVTVGIAKADDSVLIAPGTATSHGTTGQYKYILAPQTALNVLDVTWTGTFSSVVQAQTDQVEIVGGVYCSIAELLAMPGLSSATADTLAQRRREFESLAERYNGVAWVPRYARDILRGDGCMSVLLNNVRPRSILSASSTDNNGTVTAFTTTNWRVTDPGMLFTDGDALTRSWYGERNLTIEYEHGHDAPPPELVQACKNYVAAKVLQGTSQRARDELSVTDPAGFSTRYSTPDWNAGRPTGLLDVDDVLNALGRRAPMIA